MRGSHFNPSAKGPTNRQHIADEIRARHLTNAPIVTPDIPGGLNLVAQEVPNARPENPGRSPESPAEDSTDEFDKRLAKAYGDVNWSEQDKDFLRASGLI